MNKVTFSSFSGQFKQLDTLDTTVQTGESSQGLISCETLSAMPLQCFLHPYVMCWADTQGQNKALHGTVVRTTVCAPRGYNNVCTPEDKMLLSVPFTWIFTGNQFHKHDRHCLFKHLKERLLCQSRLSLSPKFPEELFISQYQGSGQERPGYSRLLKQHALAKWLPILDTLETLFLIVNLFYVVHLIFHTPKLFLFFF